MKKVLSTFLILCMLVLFIACSSNSGDESTLNPTTMEKPAETNTPDIYYEPDELPDGMNFDTTIKILTQRTAVNELSAESLNSDVINDSIYNREVFVEDRLGVEIEIIGAEIRTELEKQMVSDEDNFQIVSNPVFTLSDDLFTGTIQICIRSSILILTSPGGRDILPMPLKLTDVCILQAVLSHVH